MNSELTTQTEPSGSPLKAKPRVLVVDDSPSQLKLYQLIADQLGVTLVTVQSCREALNILELAAVDIILMDWEMPEIDGLVCTSIIRKREIQLNRRTPIIAVTWHNAAGNRETCLEAGLDDYLSKPFTFEQLNEKLLYWLKQSRSL